MGVATCASSRKCQAYRIVAIQAEPNQELVLELVLCGMLSPAGRWIVYSRNPTYMYMYVEYTIPSIRLIRLIRGISSRLLGIPT